jgi:hypothetical protein
MRGKPFGKGIFVVCAGVCALLARPEGVCGQSVSSEPAGNARLAEQKWDPEGLGSLLRQLQVQVQELNAQVQNLKAQQESAQAESAALRKELEAAKSQLSAFFAQPVGPAAAQAMPGNTNSQLVNEDRNARLEENLQLAESKIAEQSQTKVESSSKYRLRLSGIVLLNMYANRGSVENQDFPQLATAPGLLSSDGTFGGSLRQSQIGLQGFGPTIGGARTSADIQLDFAGGFQAAPNGVSFGIMRLRTGTIRFDWSETSVIAGQDSLFIAPLGATSIATLAAPAFAYSGNLWSWAPQVRVEHRFTVSDNSSFLIQGGILDSFSGDTPFSEYYRNSTWGEDSGQPAYAARISWTHAVHGENLTVGAGGYYGRQSWGFGRGIDGWAGTLDLTVPLGSRFEFAGQYYRGRAVGGLGGGIGQSALWNGSLLDPATEVFGLNSMGGWTQLKYKATSKLQFNGAFGQDNPLASDLREYGGSQNYYPSPLAKNQTELVNFLYQPRSDVVLSLEYRRLRTFTLDSNANTANIVNLSVGYIF